MCNLECLGEGGGREGGSQGGREGVRSHNSVNVCSSRGAGGRSDHKSRAAH